MSIRIASIGVSHWQALYDAAYLHRLARMPDVQLVGLHDPAPQIAAQRSAVVGNPPIFTDKAEKPRAALRWCRCSPQRRHRWCMEDRRLGCYPGAQG
jgi:hypothetical protein